jgi:PleD family two-component response regulator
LTAISGLNPADTLRQLARLVTLGFVVAVEPAGNMAVYRLNSKGIRTEAARSHRRILLVEDDMAVREMMTLLLQEEGYVVVVARAPAEARALLRAVAFVRLGEGSF